MNKSVIHKMILNFKREPNERRVVGVSPTRIDIVRCEHNFLAEQFVVQHQHGPIEKLELVVPQNMKDSWLGGRSVPKKPRIECEHSCDLLDGTSLFTRIPLQVEKV